jgi:Bacterial Ig-like domain (group 3)
MFGRSPALHHHRRMARGGLALALVGGVCAIPLAVVLSPIAAGASTVTYTPGTPTVDTITNGTSAAPWNTSQGDSSVAQYDSQAPGTLLPTYTPGGTSTGTGVSAEPNLAVYPAADSGTDGDSPYPSGTVGTPGPLDGYCGSGNQTTETTGSPVRQPSGSVLPFAPAYFPHIVKNADGSLTGYFDYRPKDADEAIVAATSTDNGKSWTYQGEALEQNPGYCPSADTNDDGQGHPNVLTIGSNQYLYTLQRPAGDNTGIGMLVHQLTPSGSNPLAGLPSAEKVGIDPDGFVPTGDGVTVPFTGGSAVSISVSTTGTAGSPEQLVAGKFVDLTQDPTPTNGDVISCTGVTANSLTGCTTAQAAGLAVNAGDLIEQVIGTTSSATVPAGPNTTTGDGGLASLTVTVTNSNNLTMATLNDNAPNRLYLNGVAVYCSQSNALPTTKIEDCTTGSGGTSLSVPSGAILTSDPIIPVTAQVTSGLVAPDGIVGTLPSYPGAPDGSTIVMYTEKILNYYDVGYTGSATTFSAGMSIAYTDFPNSGSVSLGSGPDYTVSIGDNTNDTIATETCTGLTTSATGGTLTGCNGGTVGDAIAKNSYLGGPGAATATPAVLAQTGEGSATSAQKLFKNNEDLTLLRVAYTTDGLNFSTAGLANSGIISGASNGASNYQDINNPTSTTDPAGGLNAYSAAGTADATEMRWVGSSGSIIVNPDGSYGLFLSGAWEGDGDSDAFNQIFYSQSTDGENWSIPTTVISTDYTFSASVAQDNALADGQDDPLGISAYYSGRAYGPSVVQNSDGSLTMVFAGYRSPKPIVNAGTVMGTNSEAQWTVGATDPALYRNILTVTLNSSTSPAVATSLAVNASPTSPVAGQTVTLSATASVTSPGTGTPTGTVTFSDTGGQLCQGTLDQDSPDVATCTTTLPAGSADISASYSGDSNYGTSTGSTSLTVGQDLTTTSVLGSPTTVVVGQSVTYTATVDPNSPGGGTPTGSVAFTDDDSALDCAGTLSNASPPTATCTVSEATAGSHTIGVTYSGDSSFLTSTGPATEQVDPAGTTTVLSFSPQSPVAAQPVTLTATVSATSPGGGNPAGSVDFTGDSGQLCTATLSGGSPDTASCTTSYPGSTTDTVTASYQGNTNYLSSSAQQTIGVNAAAPAVTATSASESPSSLTVGQAVTLQAVVSTQALGVGTPNGSVTFSDSGGTLCSAPLSQTAPATASCTTSYGTVRAETVTATFAGNASFASSSSNVAFTVGAASATTLAASSNPVNTGDPVTYTATVAPNPSTAGTPTGTVAFTDNGVTIAGCGAVPLAGGTSTPTATCTTTYSSGGSQTPIVGTYSGDQFFSSSASSGLTESVTSSGNPPATVTSSNSASSTSPTGTATATDGGATATGTGAGTVTVSTYSGDPTTSAVSGGTGTYIDLNVASGSSFSSVSLTVCNLNGGNSIKWFDGAHWQNFSVQTFDPSTGCVTATVNSSTLPTLAQLTGTPVASVFAPAGYWMVARDGGVFSFGDAGFYGSAGSLRLNQPIVGMAGVPTGGGYWLVAADGGIFSYGDAQFYGSAAGSGLPGPFVGMSATPTGKGYWIVNAAGAVRAYGDAINYGGASSLTLKQPIVAIQSTPNGQGYWLVAADGGIFSYGDAQFYGSTGSLHLNAPIVGMAPTPTGQGYWLVASDGGIFSYGDAQFYGSTGSLKLNAPVVGMEASDSGHGYLLVAADGGVFAYGDGKFDGSTGSLRLNQPVVGASAG